MKRLLTRLSVVTLLISTALTGMAAPKESTDTISVERAFIQMPMRQLDLLDKGTRTDMLTYWANDSIWEATNIMGGKSYISKLDNDFMEIIITPVSSLQLKVLPKAKGGNIVCAIYSINTQPGELAGDSEVLFYDSNMNPYPEKQVAKMFKIPGVRQFISIPKGSITTMKELEEMVAYPTMFLNLNGTDNDMEARLTVGEYMDQDDYNILRIFLRPNIKFHWNGKEFKLIKTK